MSSETFSRRREALSYRQAFAETWRNFLHQTYEGPEHVAYAFGVNARTAENWWSGLNAPGGWAVGRALSDPDTRGPALRVLTGTVAA